MRGGHQRAGCRAEPIALEVVEADRAHADHRSGAGLLQQSGGRVAGQYLGLDLHRPVGGRGANGPLGLRQVISRVVVACGDGHQPERHVPTERLVDRPDRRMGTGP